MKLSEHFSLKEFTRSHTAERHGLDNSAPPFVVDNLRYLVERVLDPIAEELGPVRILSGYRCPELNALVKGNPRSQHLRGQAADIEVIDVSNHTVSRWIQDNLVDFDQLIEEHMKAGDPTAGWIHISCVASPHRNRRSVLAIG